MRKMCTCIQYDDALMMFWSLFSSFWIRCVQFFSLLTKLIWSDLWRKSNFLYIFRIEHFFIHFLSQSKYRFFLYSKKIERKKKIETACPLITIFFRCVFPFCTVSGLFCILDDWTVRSTSNKHRKKWNGKRFTDFFSAFDWKRKTKFFISFREF